MEKVRPWRARPTVGSRTAEEQNRKETMAVARSSSGAVDALCTSGFMDDVIFAHKPRLLDVAAQLKRSAHAALGLAVSCAQ